MVHASNFCLLQLPSFLLFQMCWDAITVINKEFNDTLSLDFVTPKIVKGFMGAVIKNHDVPQEYRITKRE